MVTNLDPASDVRRSAHRQNQSIGHSRASGNPVPRPKLDPRFRGVTLMGTRKGHEEGCRINIDSRPIFFGTKPIRPLESMKCGKMPHTLARSNLGADSGSPVRFLLS